VDTSFEPSPGYAVTPDELSGAARSVDDVLGELRSLGVGVGQAEAGRGVWTLAARAGPTGHAGLDAAFASFCGRWEWGVRTLVQAGREMADGLRDAAAAYAGADRDQHNLFQEIADLGPDLPWADAGRSMAETWTAVGREVAGGAAAGQLDDLAVLREIVE
jgi:hypothetical protein